MADLILTPAGDALEVRPGMLISVPHGWCPEPARVDVRRVEPMHGGGAQAWGWEQTSGRWVCVVIKPPPAPR